MQRLMDFTRLIVTMIFTYLQVHEYRYFLFCPRQLAIRLSIASALTPRSQSTAATREVDFLTNVEVLLLLFALSGLQALLRVFGLVGDGVILHDTHVVNTIRPLRPYVPD